MTKKRTGLNKAHRQASSLENDRDREDENSNHAPIERDSSCASLVEEVDRQKQHRLEELPLAYTFRLL